MSDSTTPSIPDRFCPECVTCLEQSAPECPDCDASPPSDGWPPVSDSPYAYLGEFLDERYIVDQFVDSGASGHVYRARGPRFSQQFAVKIVDLRRYDDEMRSRLVDRFYQEVDTVARIKNPHVIDIYEALQLGEGVFGLVMNFVEGQTLDSMLEDRQRLTIDEATDLARQVATGLHEAHRRGLVHRDVKPENVIVEQMPASGYFARVLDFGVAVAEGAEDNFGFQGTPLYASPEQCTEENLPDVRSDIYGLGCLLFHLLTGQPPFPYTNALRVMDAHVDAPRPRLDDATDLVDFPEELENIVAHLLARDPEDRPETLDVVCRALSAFEDGDPVPELGDPPAYRKEAPDQSFPGLDSITPPPEEYVSIGDRTSSQLAAESTMPEPSELPRWESDAPIDLEMLEEFEPVETDDHQRSVTATALDPRGLACLVADAAPSVHLFGLGGEPFTASFELDQMISAVDADLQNGQLLVGDVRGQVLELDPGSGRPLDSHSLSGTPMAMVTTSSGRLIVGTERGQVSSVDPRTDSRHEVARFHHTVSALHAPGDQTLLVGLWDGSVALIDEQRRRWHLPVAPDAVADLGVIDSDRYFAVDGRGTIHVGSRRTGEIESSIDIGPGVRTIRRLTDDRMLMLSIFDEGIQIWNVDLHPDD